jgi:hypothetical protein
VKNSEGDALSTSRIPHFIPVALVDGLDGAFCMMHFFEHQLTTVLEAMGY